MASKQNISLHLDGINACEDKEYEHALGLFKRISEPSAPIFFNMGCCHLKLGSPSEALKMFQQCVAKDKYLAVGFFQLGIAQTFCGDSQAAISSFQAAYSALRGNPFIDYKQLNMSCKLYTCEIHFNLALIYLFTGAMEDSHSSMDLAVSTQSDNSRHACIPDAATSMRCEDWDYFGEGPVVRLINLPEMSFFRVSKAKMEGLQTSTKFMDSAKVVSASKEEYSFVGFVGAKKKPPSNPVQSSPTKRPSPPAGPPPPMPTVPPPRLPSGVSPPDKNLPAPIPIKPNGVPDIKTPPSKPAPSRPPPPAVTAPRPVSPGTPPVRRSNQTSHDPGKPPSGSPTPTSVMSELKKSMDNARIKSSPTTTPKNAKQNYTPVIKKNQPVHLECDFTLSMKQDISYPELLTQLSERLSQAAADLEKSLQRRTMTLSLQDPTTKNNINITSQNSAWQSTWLSMIKNRQTRPVLTLKETSSNPSPSHAPVKMSSSPRHSPTPRSTSPGYKPTRPAPTYPPEVHSATYRNDVQEDIYHDIS